jgi:MraZ protein
VVSFWLESGQKVESQAQTGKRRHPRGMFTSRVDEKGRLKLPEDIKRYLQEIGSAQVFITSFDGRIARIYPTEAWEKAEEMLEQPGPNAIEGRQLLFQAQRFGGDAEIDGQGRLLMPATLRRSMQVENQPVHLAFFRGHIEVYADQVFQRLTETADENNEQKVNTFVEMGLP